jgi:hypothetical protein
MTINLLSYMKILWLCEVIPFSKSLTLISSYEVTIERKYADTRCTAGEHYSEIPKHAPTCPSSNAKYNPESDPELQLQCQYRTSLTRLIFGGATIFKEGDDSAGIATTPTANYRTGRAGTKHRETHSPIEKASNGEKCTQRSDGKRTYR